MERTTSFGLIALVAFVAVVALVAIIAPLSRTSTDAPQEDLLGASTTALSNYAPPVDPLLIPPQEYLLVSAESDPETGDAMLSVFVDNAGTVRQRVYARGYYFNKFGVKKPFTFPGSSKSWVEGEASMTVAVSDLGDEGKVIVLACRQYRANGPTICGPKTANQTKRYWTAQTFTYDSDPLPSDDETPPTEIVPGECEDQNKCATPPVYAGDRAVLEEHFTKNNVDRSKITISREGTDTTIQFYYGEGGGKALFKGEILTELSISNFVDGTMFTRLEGIKKITINKPLDVTKPKWTEPRTQRQYYQRLAWPAWVTELESLEELTFTSASFEYAEPEVFTTVPESIGGLRNLRTLHFGGDWVRGTMPQAIGTLTNLEVLNWQYTETSGTLPDLSGLRKLRILWLAYNKFNGPIPPLCAEEGSGSMSDSPWLQSVDLNDNQFSGSIDFLQTCSRLQALNLKNNAFTGPLPGFSRQASQLFSFSIDNNKITGPVPESWKQQNSMVGVVSLYLQNTCVDVESVKAWCEERGIKTSNCVVTRAQGCS